MWIQLVDITLVVERKLKARELEQPVALLRKWRCNAYLLFVL